MKGDSAITVGKRRGLQVSSNDDDRFSILAIDHGLDMKVTIRPEDPNTVGYEEIVAVKARLIDTLAPSVSAVLLDPIFGLAPAVLQDRLPGNVGMLLSIEDGDYASSERPARIIDGWSVSQIKSAGGAAVKVYFHYHPDDIEMARAQEAFVSELVAECKAYDLPLFAEPISYGVSGDEKRRVVIESGRRFSELGIDILKAEFPLDIGVEKNIDIWQDACHELSEAIDVPWVLLSAGVDFTTFTSQVTAACKGGASGYLAGRAIWKEGMTLNAPDQEGFLRTRAVARLQTLTGIVQEYARPWTAIYRAEPVSEGWHKQI